MLKQLGATLDVLRLEPADLGERVPLWETALEPGAPAVAVVDGSAGEWRDAEAAVQRGHAELSAAPVVTIAVVRNAEPGPLARACDLIVRDTASCDAMLARVEATPGPALVAAQLLRAGDARIATESFAYATLLASAPFRAWRTATGIREPEAAWASPRVEIDDHDDTTIVRLARPSKHNAYDARMREHLCDALDAVAGGCDGPVVLVGAGRSFCAGGDLDEFGRATDPLGAHLVRVGRSVARRIERIADRLVVGIHGHCIGAGVELAAYARVVVAATSATFALPELSLGLSLGAGGSVSLPRRVGRHRTLELLLLAEPIDALRAHADGLVDELVEPDELEARCLARAEELR